VGNNSEFSHAPLAAKQHTFCIQFDKLVDASLSFRDPVLFIFKFVYPDVRNLAQQKLFFLLQWVLNWNNSSFVQSY